MTVIVLGSVALAQTTVTQVTTNAYEDTLPQIRGDSLVWQGYVGGNWEIFACNTRTGVTTQITQNDYDDLAPQTNGAVVVWQGFANDEWDIFLWDGLQTRMISEASAEDVSPQIVNGFVVWTTEPMVVDSQGPGEIVLYDISTETRTILSSNVDPGNALDDSAPRINDEVVIWIQNDGEDNTTLYLYDLSAGTTTANPDYLWIDRSQKDGDFGVLSKHDGNDMELFLKSSQSGKLDQITSNSIQERYPTISGNRIAWMAGGEIFLAEFKVLNLVSPKDEAALAQQQPPTFVWEAAGYDAFEVHFSGDPNFQKWRKPIFPSKGRDSLSETYFTPALSEWNVISSVEAKAGIVFWRIAVKDADGNETYSNTRRFTVN